MFCYQCEQALRGNCNIFAGVCGKDDKTAVLQDVLIYSVKELSGYLTEQKENKNYRKFSGFVVDALFTTVTNVNFDSEKVQQIIVKSFDIIDELKKAQASNTKEKSELADINPHSIKELLDFGKNISIEVRKMVNGETITGLEELVLYGVKGLAAYVHHACILGYENDELYDFINSALHFLTTRRSVESLLGKALETGKYNLSAMELLDKANTEIYGHPEPTQVRISALKGKAILVSGHDLKILEELLKQTKGMGINVYTHSEMLPANSYPGLKKYKHLIGNYGGAWQDQIWEFDNFPGAILMTTNCIQMPRDSYFDRIFTAGLVEWEGVQHISDLDFTPVIEKALQSEGFKNDEPERFITTGFGRNTVMSVAGQVIDAVKSGAIKHFFLIGGCDGMKPGRNYYSDFALAAPKDTIILTLACGKYRFNKFEFGDIGGIPRLLDIGQCNDAYSAIQIAVALANAFETDVNSLPLSMILSWYEQKAVAILLTLLYLGIKNIRLGPSLPSFITSEVLNILVENYNIMPITNVKDDMAQILAN